MAPERIRKWAGTHRNFFLVVPLHFFGSMTKISRFGERFRGGQYSLVSFLFAVLSLTVPPCTYDIEAVDSERPKYMYLSGER